MTTTLPKLLTAADLLRLHSEGVRGELIRGVLCDDYGIRRRTRRNRGQHDPVVGKPCETAETQAGWPLRMSAFGCNATPIRYANPTWRSSLPRGFLLMTRVTGYYEVPPDLVVEIVSPNDSYGSVHDKACMWLRYGVRIVWVVNPQFRLVEDTLGRPITTEAYGRRHPRRCRRPPRLLLYRQ